MKTDRRRDLGGLGERLAERHLRSAGYHIVERNLRTCFGELDLVAADAHALVFCEVKTRLAGSRNGPAGPLESIGPQKQRRVRRLARAWLADQPASSARPARPNLRFDAIGVVLDGAGRLVDLEHVEGAF